MKKKAFSMVAGAAFTLAFICSQSQPVYAQQEKGDKELLLNGTLSVAFAEGETATTGLGVLGLGYFVTRKQEVGLGLTFIVFSAEGSTSVIASPSSFYRYNFASEGAKTFPYVGVEGGAFFFGGGGLDTSTLGYVRPNVGFKYFFKKNAAFDVNGGYLRLFGGGGGSNQMDARLGLSFIF